MSNSFLTKCIFCNEQRDLTLNPLRDSGIKSRIICESQDWYCVPTLGCFEEGYVLLISKRHHACISNASTEEIDDLLCLEKKISRLFKRKYSTSFICFEHGVTSLEYSGANSVDHAHLHMIPIKAGVWANIMDKGLIQEFIRFDDQRLLYKYVKDTHIKSYLLFQDSDGKLFLIPDASRYHSQFFRKVIANELNCAIEWNWKQSPCLEKMMKTYTTLKRET